MIKIPIDTYGEGSCCPECKSTRITRHEQRNLQVDTNLSSGKVFVIRKGKMKSMSNRDKANAFDSADMSGGGGCWSYECRKCGWRSETFTE